MIYNRKLRWHAAQPHEGGALHSHTRANIRVRGFHTGGLVIDFVWVLRAPASEQRDGVHMKKMFISYVDLLYNEFFMEPHFKSVWLNCHGNTRLFNLWKQASNLNWKSFKKAARVDEPFSSKNDCAFLTFQKGAWKNNVTSTLPKRQELWPKGRMMS